MGFILPQEKILFPLENLSSVFLIFLGGWVVTNILNPNRRKGKSAAMVRLP
jgi:hypothetical protein